MGSKPDNHHAFARVDMDNMAAGLSRVTRRASQTSCSCCCLLVPAWGVHATQGLYTLWLRLPVMRVGGKPYRNLVNSAA